MYIVCSITCFAMALYLQVQGKLPCVSGRFSNSSLS